jgi:hypothetical protein
MVILPKLPEGLAALECSYNNLQVLPKLPKSLKSLICDHNDLKRIEKLPKTLSKLNCRKNPLVFIRPLPKRPYDYILPKQLRFSQSKGNYETYYSRYQTYKYLVSFLVLEFKVFTVLFDEDFWFPPKYAFPCAEDENEEVSTEED